MIKIVNCECVTPRHSNGSYIEIVVCAYHLKHSGKRHASVGVEGVDWTKQGFFTKWDVLKVTHFNARAKSLLE